MSEYNDVTPLIFGRPGPGAAGEPETAAETERPDLTDAPGAPDSAGQADEPDLELDLSADAEFAGEVVESGTAEAGVGDNPDLELGLGAGAESVGEVAEGGAGDGPDLELGLGAGAESVDEGVESAGAGADGELEPAPELGFGAGAESVGQGAESAEAEAARGDREPDLDGFGVDAGAVDEAEADGGSELEPEPFGELQLDLTSTPDDGPSTYGHPEVDAVVERLDELDHLETADHIEVYEDAHHRLHETLLAAGNERASDTDSTANAQPSSDYA